jgi:hypothetical protein
MLVKTDHAATAKLSAYCKDLYEPDLMDTNKVPSILWRGAEASYKFYTDNTISSYMTTVKSNTFHLYNTNILYYIARKFETVKRSWDDRGKDPALAAGCDTPTAVQLFLASELIPQQVTRKAAAEILISLANLKKESSTMQPPMFYYDLCRINDFIDSIAMHAMLSFQQRTILFAEGLAE